MKEREREREIKRAKADSFPGKEKNSKTTIFGFLSFTLISESLLRVKYSFENEV
jgi:hypothetical protein